MQPGPVLLEPLSSRVAGPRLSIPSHYRYAGFDGPARLVLSLSMSRKMSSSSSKRAMMSLRRLSPLISNALSNFPWTSRRRFIKVCVSSICDRNQGFHTVAASSSVVKSWEPPSPSIVPTISAKRRWPNSQVRMTVFGFTSGSLPILFMAPIRSQYGSFLLPWYHPLAGVCASVPVWAEVEEQP
ncbi:hypothetical protein DL764_005767 [Monosporascus ibericus]|uniref:Uncharacterized protein n=1 Tax=Monosporascus ibericus TaxID=155417 RepID=A0A4Q4TBJ6_9PEZI|nr:hypothetical protein DL764_005767 [Monosporascus ibericus]